MRRTAVLRRPLAAVAAAVACVALSVSAASPVAAAVDPSAGSAMTPELHERIQERVDSFLIENDLPGISVAVVTPDPHGPDPVITTFAAGVMDLDTKTPVDASTQFELGSETKVFTADLLAYLVAAGRVSLDDTVQQYAPEGITVPEWVDPQTGATTAITLRDLATHQAGLTDVPPNFWAECGDEDHETCNPRPGYTQKRLWHAFSLPCEKEGMEKVSCPVSEPGTDWLYSNWGFGLLGTILANVVNPVPEQDRPAFEPALDEAFLDALGLSSTTLEDPDDARLASSYTWKGGTAFRWDNWNALAGGGGLISDANDMGTWVAAHLGYVSADAPLGVRTMADTLVPVSTITSHCTAPGNCEPADFAMGLGWQLHAGGDVGAPWAFKNGGTAGSSSDTALAPSLRMGVTTMYNKQRPPSDQGLQLAVSLLTVLVAEHNAPAPTPSPVPAPAPVDGGGTPPAEASPSAALAATGSAAPDIALLAAGAVLLIVLGGVVVTRRGERHPRTP